MRDILLRHFRAYPLMEPIDAVKLIYQSEFGGGHMIANPKDSLRRLEQEWDCLPKDRGTGLRLEDIGGGLCRLYLDGGAHWLGLNAVNALFVQASQSHTGSRQGFAAKLEDLKALCAEGSAPFPLDRLLAYLRDYQEQGCPAVSHSPAYRAGYDPHYRLVDRSLLCYGPALAAMGRLLAASGRALVAVDGCSGSGKSHLAGLAGLCFPATVIHMDDYFLQPHQRAPERLAQTGGNIDYERFLEQVIAPIRRGQPPLMQRYDCASGALGPVEQAPDKPLILVEGVYSMHPNYRDQYDLRILLQIPSELQRKRVLARSGPQLFQRFEREWIPMENQYFAQTAIEQACDLIVDTSAL